MLVLTRKHNETLHIGDDIVITIVRARGSSIRIGIEAPKNVTIQRGELVGQPAKQVAAPESLPVIKHIGDAAPSAKKIEHSKKPATAGQPVQSKTAAGSGPLSKFLTAVPKVQLATAS